MPPAAGIYPKQEANAASGGNLSQARGQRRQRRETTPSRGQCRQLRETTPSRGQYRQRRETTPSRGQYRQRRETTLSKRPMPQAAGSYPRTGKYQSNHGKNSHLYPVQKTATPETGDRPNTFHSFLIRQSAQTKTPPETVSPLSPNGKQDVPHTRQDSRLRTATAGDSGCCLL